MSSTWGKGYREPTGKTWRPFHASAPFCASSCGSETKSSPGGRWDAARRPSPAAENDTGKGWSETPSPAPAAGFWWRPFAPFWRRAFLCQTDPPPSPPRLMQEEADKEEKGIRATAQYVTGLSWNVHPPWTSSASENHVNPPPINLGQIRVLGSSCVFSHALDTIQDWLSTVSCVQGKLPPEETVWGKHLTPLRLPDRPH